MLPIGTEWVDDCLEFSRMEDEEIDRRLQEQDTEMPEQLRLKLAKPG